MVNKIFSQLFQNTIEMDEIVKLKLLTFVSSHLVQIEGKQK